MKHTWHKVDIALMPARKTWVQLLLKGLASCIVPFDQGHYLQRNLFLKRPTTIIWKLEIIYVWLTQSHIYVYIYMCSWPEVFDLSTNYQIIKTHCVYIIFKILHSFLTSGDLLIFFARMWHKAIWMGNTMGPQFIFVGLLVELAKCYTTRDAQFPDKCLGLRLKFADKFTEIVPSDFGPFMGHHQHVYRVSFFFSYFLTIKI